MDPKQITNFAKLLKDSGDKILNSEFKLTLSGSLLRALNDSFSLIIDRNEILPPHTFQVVKPNNAKSDVFRDLQFIYDFIQKTLVLYLNQFLNDDPYEFECDISKFRCLRKLEINRIAIRQVFGLQSLRSQLQEITCNRCIENISEIITDCGGDNSNGFVWNELKFANFSFNNLHHIDDSLEFTPWLEILNLSHNKITSVSAIKWLPNLKVLNLCFNHLKHIPALHTETMKKLQILLLSNNFIEDLNGISRLDSLQELDISSNCIIDHSALLPLTTLASLQYLNLLDNPLAYHPKHRQVTARYLHKNTSSVKFMFDNVPLSKHEKTLTGNYVSYYPILMSRSTSVSGVNTPTNRRSNLTTPTGSIRGSKNSLIIEQHQQKDELSSSIVSQKKIRVRNVFISEHEDDIKSTQLKKQNSATLLKVALEGNSDHLETKKQLENLREKYGSDWLQSHGGNEVKNVIGFEERPAQCDSKGLENFLHYDTSETPKKVLPATAINVQQISKNSSTILTSTPIDSNINVTETSTKLLEDTFHSVASSDNNKQDSIYKSVLCDTTANTLNVTKSSTNRTINVDEFYSNSDTDDIEMRKENEENEISYLVKTKLGAEYFLIISDLSIREKDISTGRTKTRWSLKTLESCEQTNTNTFILNYDTMRKDKRQRIYETEANSCHEIVQFLRNILSQRPLSEMNQTIYRCAVCNANFSRENNFNNKSNNDIKCPECFSSYCIELRESPPKIVDPNQPSTSSGITSSSKQPNPPALVKSDSRSSIALPVDAWRSPIKNKLRSAGSFNDSSSCSKLSQMESSFDSNQSVAGSTNSERDKDVDLLGNESDIEILSNPSQSSIEVLDSFSTSTNRKYSEERRISQIPLLDTINDDSFNLTATLTNQGTSTHDLMVASTTVTTGETVSSENTKTETVKVVDENMDSLSTVKTPTVLQNKKAFLSAVNLTESSSSGSVTDSVCTAYESQHEPKVLSDDSGCITTSMEEKPSTSSKTPTTTTTATPEVSVISTMLGGLFQSTNLLLSKSSSNIQQTEKFEPFQFSFQDYSVCDHRLKLYFYQNIFEDDGETLKWLVSSIIFDENQTNEQPNGFEGIFLMTTTKFYIMRKIGAENDNPSKWLKKYLAGTVDRVGIAQILPWKIGIKFSINGIGNIHIILQDILRTDCMILFFAENPLNFCTLEYQPSDDLMQKLIKSTNEEKVKFVVVVNLCEILSDEVLKSFQIATLVLTDNNFILTTNIKWLNENSKYEIEKEFTQVMTNLVELETLNDLSVKLNFMDENEDKFETWRIDFVNETCKESTLNTISQSWEKIFGVPLVNNQNQMQNPTDEPNL
uniref:Putative serine/threonine-protein kinase 11-interacting protein n=1 Tax=Corethrella appendiculata TaxID=1370023 RepID=W4VR35_9DIPT